MIGTGLLMMSDGAPSMPGDLGSRLVIQDEPREKETPAVAQPGAGLGSWAQSRGAALATVLVLCLSAPGALAYDFQKPLTLDRSSTRHEWVFVDTSVVGYQDLVDDALAGGDDGRQVELVLLDSGRDGIEQIAEALAGRSGIDAIHLITHGSQAELQLGTARLTLDSMLGAHADALSEIGRALTESGDILVYGCDFGRGALGRQAAGRLAALAGADVAASDNLTGAQGLGGDWELEVRTGPIETAVALSTEAQKDWFGELSAAHFTPHTITTAALGARSVTAADLDGDGDLDVVSGSQTDNTVGWYRNDGQGNFSALITISTTATGVLSVATADLDGDGDQDVLSASPGSGTIAWYRNNGTGTFSAAINITTVLGGAAYVNTADLDGDGDLDVLSASGGPTHRVDWYRNDGTGTFSAAINIATVGAAGFTSVTSADLDGDGDRDVVSSSRGDGTIRWFQSSGGVNPTFTARIISTTALNARQVATADVNGDGRLDVLSAAQDANEIVWYENNGGAIPTFTPHTITSAAMGAYSVTTADVDGDGDLDVLSAAQDDNTIAWYENNGGAIPTFTAHTITTAALAARSVATADLDGDGDVDVLSASGTDNKVAWYENEWNPPSFTTAATGDGIVTTDTGVVNVGRGVAVQSDSKILVAGYDDIGATVYRYNTDGTLDPSFGGGDGMVMTDVGALQDYSQAVLVQSDGKILVAGYSEHATNRDWFVIRYQSDGTLDSTFGTGGKATLDFAGQPDAATGVGLQSDGKIIVSGKARLAGNDVFAVARYNTNGTLDTSFDTDGWLTLDAGTTEFGTGLVIQPDDKILFGGRAFVAGNGTFTVVRWNANGTLDLTFGGGDGIDQVDVAPGTDVAGGIALQSDGKIVMTGYNTTSGQWIVVRWNSNGVLDASFGAAGKVITDIPGGNDFGFAVKVQADGKILTAGYHNNGANDDFAAVRYNTNGSLDLSFGVGGIVTTPIGLGTDQAFDLTILPDGRIVLIGSSHNGTDEDVALVRYNSDGTLYNGFDGATTLDGAPTFSGLPVVLDADVNVRDAELDALNGGSGNYAGAGVVLARNGGASSADVFRFLAGNGISYGGGTLIKSSKVIATFDTTTTAGKLAISFTDANGQIPTSADVDNILRQIVYSNTPGPPPVSVQLNWAFTDDVGLETTGATTVTIAAAATAVELMSFTAVGVDGAVELRWETASEMDNLGFHLYRATAMPGAYQRITGSLIPGLGSSPAGARYGYRDVAVQAGVPYHYELEDVETTGKTRLHGPVSAVPLAGSGASDPADGSEDPSAGASSWIRYGDPAATSLRVVNRGRDHVDLELVTGGFWALPDEDGGVRLSIPGFEETQEPGAPGLPVRQAWLEAVAGQKVKVVSVTGRDVVTFEGLHPAVTGAPELWEARDGALHTGQRRKRPGKAFKSAGLYPKEAAQILGTAFQGEVKKAQLEMSPLRWDRNRGRLLLARRLLVRVEFGGREKDEVSRGGSRGRKERGGKTRISEGVVARLEVGSPGLYGVSYEEIFAGGGRGVSVSALSLSYQGEGVAFHVEPAGKRFGPGSALFFTSAGAALNPYGKQAVYEVSLGSGGVQMPLASAAPRGVAVSRYWPRLEREVNSLYKPTLLALPDPWLWDNISTRQTKSYAFSLSAPALSAEPGRLTVWLQGGSDYPADPDHHVRLSVNGQPVGEASWDGMEAREIEAELWAGVLHEGGNVLEITNVGDTEATYSLVILDRFAVSHPRRLVAEGGMVRGRFSESGTAAVQGVGAGAYVLDTTDPSPRWLSGMVATPLGVSFAAEAGREYQVVSPEALVRPRVVRASAGTLREVTNRAEYLVVGPRAFLEAAEPLLQQRREQGLESRAVAIEEVYDSFGSGEARPQALREFLSYAYHHWQVGPRYVLLLGDASYDFKDYLGTGVGNAVPPYMIRDTYMWTVSDPAYAAVNGEDLLPDLALGRLSAQTLEEARALVRKILAWENAGLNLSGRAVIVADNADEAGDFEGDAERTAQSLLVDREVERIYLSRLQGATRATIHDSFGRGASLMSYFGHGAIAVWASENVFNSWDVPQLAPQPQQPFLLTMNCLNGYFHMPTVGSALAEALVKAEDRGAIGTLAPSSLSVHWAARLYHDALVKEISSGRHERLGDALLAAQNAYADTGARPDLLAIYQLLADPALRIR